MTGPFCVYCSDPLTRCASLAQIGASCCDDCDGDVLGFSDHTLSVPDSGHVDALIGTVVSASADRMNALVGHPLALLPEAGYPPHCNPGPSSISGPIPPQSKDKP